MMLHSRIQRQIPERLSHYTNIEALKSILSDTEGKGICLWAFSNKYKNDDQEIKMGEYMLKRVRKALPTKSSLLHQLSGYENTASVSFMEGDVNQHMLDVYGRYRLEFDLRKVGIGILSEGLVDCEYVDANALEEYADEYCALINSTLKSIPELQKKYGKTSAPPINNLIEFLMMEQDIIAKVFCLKELKWRDEQEWRKVFELKPNDAKNHYLNSNPYVEYYLDKSMLKGITVFCTTITQDKAKVDSESIAHFITERGYNAEVRVEVFGQ
jgi:hypothetical protein